MADAISMRRDGEDEFRERSKVTGDLCSAVITVVVVTPLLCFSDLAPCFNAFGVSYWCFLNL